MQFLWPRVLWLGKSAHQTGVYLILCDPNRFEDMRERFFVARKYYFAVYLRLCLCASVLLLEFGAGLFWLLRFYGWAEWFMGRFIGGGALERKQRLNRVKSTFSRNVGWLIKTVG